MVYFSQVIHHLQGLCYDWYSLILVHYGYRQLLQQRHPSEITNYQKTFTLTSVTTACAPSALICVTFLPEQCLL